MLEEANTELKIARQPYVEYIHPTPPDYPFNPYIQPYVEYTDGYKIY